jgi:hypothetical protein
MIIDRITGFGGGSSSDDASIANCEQFVAKDIEDYMVSFDRLN